MSLSSKAAFGIPKTSDEMLKDAEEESKRNKLSGSETVTWRDLITAGISFRERCRRMVKHPKFDQVILVAILVSSVLMVFNIPLGHPKYRNFFTVSDVVFAVIFTGEMLVKMVSMGVFVNNNPAPEQFWGTGSSEGSSDEETPLSGRRTSSHPSASLESLSSDLTPTRSAQFVAAGTSTETADKKARVMGPAKKKKKKLAGVMPEEDDDDADEQIRGGMLAAQLGPSKLGRTMDNIGTNERSVPDPHPHKRRASLEDDFDLAALQAGHTPKHDADTRRKSLAKKDHHGLFSDMGGPDKHVQHGGGTRRGQGVVVYLGRGGLGFVNELGGRVRHSEFRSHGRGHPTAILTTYRSLV